MPSRLNKLSNLQQRIITGTIGALLMVCGVYYNAFTFGALFLTISILAQIEFYRLAKVDKHLPLVIMGTFIGAVLFIITFCYLSGFLPGRTYLLLFPLCTLIYFVKLYKREEKPFTNIAFTFLGIVYVALPLSLFQYVAFQHHIYQWQMVAGSLFLLWASDTGAYFAGTLFGKKKLFPRISPKKSWEGTIGGLVASMLIALLLSQIFVTISPWKWFIMSGLIVVAGTYGDLVESMLKRSISIKDSGSILPGHGGFLDRFDGLLLSTPYISTFLALSQGY
jgi:phosphatidate cytidylyltransferase